MVVFSESSKNISKWCQTKQIKLSQELPSTKHLWRPHLCYGDVIYASYPVVTGRKLNLHKIQSYILCTFNLRPVSTG